MCQQVFHRCVAIVSVKIDAFSAVYAAIRAVFHYRNLDVSTLKELCKRWNPASLEGFSKESTHLALDDVRDSIAELKHYRQTMLKI